MLFFSQVYHKVYIVIQSFGTPVNVKVLLPNMIGRQITCAHDIFPFIEVIENPNDPNMHNIFLLWLHRYLRGRGHPISTQTVSVHGVEQHVDMLSPEIRAQAVSDTTYRARRLMLTLCGSELMPVPSSLCLIEVSRLTIILGTF